MKVLLLCAVICMFWLCDRSRNTEDKAIHLARLLMHLPSKHTDTIFTFRAASSAPTDTRRTMNSLIFILIPKNPLFSSNSLLDSHNGHCSPPLKNLRQRCLTMLLLLMAGISPNPGPVGNISTPLDFSNRSGLGIVHSNVRSLLPKLDQVKIWAKTTKADILVISETCLKQSISSHDIALEGYHVFRVDRKSKGGGIAMSIKGILCSFPVLSSSYPTVAAEYLYFNVNCRKYHSPEPSLYTALRLCLCPLPPVYRYMFSRMEASDIQRDVAP